MGDVAAPDDVAHLLDVEPEGEDTVTVLERFGLELGDFEEHVSARAATADERRSLRLADGVSVIVLIRTTYTTDGRPVEASRGLLAADRHQLSYRLPART